MAWHDGGGRVLRSGMPAMLLWRKSEKQKQAGAGDMAWGRGSMEGKKRLRLADMRTGSEVRQLAWRKSGRAHA